MREPWWSVFESAAELRDRKRLDERGAEPPEVSAIKAHQNVMLRRFLNWMNQADADV